MRDGESLIRGQEYAFHVPLNRVGNVVVMGILKMSLRPRSTVLRPKIAIRAVAGSVPRLCRPERSDDVGRPSRYAGAGSVDSPYAGMR